MRTGRAVEADLARLRRADAEDDLGELAAPGADQAGEADDLAGADRQADVVEQRRAGEPPHLEQRRADRGLELGEEVLDACARPSC